MKTKSFIAILWFFLNAGGLLFSDAKVKPNILWIIAEDMSQDLGCYGNELVHTPNIDRLARKGMRFKNVFTTGPACSPSRTALATGVYQTTLGAYHMRYSDDLMPRLPEGIETLPELLRKNGYITGNINTRSRAVRTDRYKYIRNYKIPGSINESTTAYRRAMHPIYHLLNIMGEKDLLTSVQAQNLKPIAAEELYDIERDPYETANLVESREHRGVLEELRVTLAAWIESSGDRGFEEESPAITEYFSNYGKTTTKDLKKYGATTTDKLQEDFDRMRKYVESYFK